MGALVERFVSLVYSVARRDGLEISEAEDCCQQTWMALYEFRRRIRDGEKLSGWLAATANRRAMRILRKQASLRRSEAQAPDSEPPLTPEEQLLIFQRRSILEAVLSERDECRQPIRRWPRVS